MKSFFMILVFASSAVYADRYIHPTIPGTGFRDYSQPGLGIDEQGNAYQTIPGTTFKDYSKPGYTTQGNKIYQTIPGTNFRDYSKPGYVYED